MKHVLTPIVLGLGGLGIACGPNVPYGEDESGSSGPDTETVTSVTTASTSDTGNTDDPPEPACGNGVVDPGEDCDDGNTDNNDECNRLCLISGSEQWSLTLPPEIPPSYGVGLGVDNNKRAYAGIVSPGSPEGDLATLAMVSPDGDLGWAASYVPSYLFGSQAIGANPSGGVAWAVFQADQQTAMAELYGPLGEPIWSLPLPGFEQELRGIGVDSTGSTYLASTLFEGEPGFSLDRVDAQGFPTWNVFEPGAGMPQWLLVRTDDVAVVVVDDFMGGHRLLRYGTDSNPQPPIAGTGYVQRAWAEGAERVGVLVIDPMGLSQVIRYAADGSVHATYEFAVAEPVVGATARGIYTFDEAQGFLTRRLYNGNAKWSADMSGMYPISVEDDSGHVWVIGYGPFESPEPLAILKQLAL